MKETTKGQKPDFKKGWRSRQQWFNTQRLIRDINKEEELDSELLKTFLN